MLGSAGGTLSQGGAANPLMSALLAAGDRRVAL